MKAKRIWWTGAVFVAVLILAMGLLHTSLVRRIFLNRLTSSLKNSQGLVLEASGLQYNLFSLWFSLEGVSLRDTAAAGLPPILTAGRIQMRLRYSDLFRRPFEGHWLGIEKPDLQVVIRGDGSSNLPRILEQNTGSSSFRLPLNALDVSDLSFSVNDERDDFVLELPSASLLGRTADPKTGLELRSTLSKAGNIRWRGRQLPVEQMGLEIVLLNDHVMLRSLRLLAAGSEVTARGTLRDPSSPRLEATAQTDFQSAPLASWLGLSVPVEGRLGAQLSFSGNLKQPVVEVGLRADPFEISGIKMKFLAGNGRFDPSTGILELKGLSSEVYSGRVELGGKLALTGKGQSSLICEAKGLNLRQISSAPAIRALPPGSLSASVTAGFTGLQWGDSRVSARTAVTFSPGRGSREASTITGAVDARFRGQQADVTINSISGEGASLRGSLSYGIRDQSIKGELSGKIDKLSRVVQRIEATLNKPAGSLLPFPLDGSAEWSASLSGTLSQPVAKVQVDASDLSSGSVSNAAIHLEGAYAADRLVIERSRLQWRGQAGSVEGEIGFGSGSAPIHLEALLDGVAVEEILKGLALNPVVSGSANARILAEGTVQDPRARIQFDVQGIEAYGEKLGILTGEADLKEGILSLSRLELDKPQEGGNGRLEASGSLQLNSRECAFSVKGTNLSFQNLLLPGDVSVTGAIQLSAGGSGSLDNLAVQAKAEGKDLRVSGTDFSQLQADLNLANHKADLKITDPGRGITANAEIDLTESYPIRVEIKAPQYSQIFENAGKKAAELSTAAIIHGEGSLKPLEVSSASAQLSEFRIDLGEEKIRSEKPIEIGFADGRFRLLPVTLASGKIRLQLGGDLPIEIADGSEGISLKGDIELDVLSALFPTAPKMETRGKVTLNGEIRGNWKDLRPSATAVLAGGYLHSDAFPGSVEDLRAEVRLSDGRITIGQLYAKIGDGTIQAGADFPMDFLVELPGTNAAPVPPAHFSVQADRIPWSSLIALSEGVAGQFSGKLTGEASALAADKVTAELKVTESSLRRDPFVLQAEPANISIRNGLIHIEPWHWTTTRGEILVSGTAGLTGDLPLELHLTGNVDASVASLLSPAAIGAGSLRVDLRSIGTVSDPVLSGVIEMDKGSIGLKQPRLLIEDLDLKVGIDSNNIQIEQMSGVLNGSRVQGSGRASVHKGKLEDVGVDLAGNDVFFEFPKGMKSASNVKLEVRSKDHSILIGGNIEIREGSYREPIDLSGAGSVTSEAAGLTESSGKLEILGSPIRLDIKVRTRQPVEIDNNLARLSASADVRLVGDVGTPGLLGAMTLERAGKIFFGGRSYYIERGIVTFSNEARVDPVFDLLATTQVNEYMIALRLSGTGSEVSSTFTSDPPLSQTDVISVLLTGKPISESGGSRVDAAQAEKMSLLSSAINADLSARARRSFGISQVMIQPSLVSGESDPGARLTVGQDLSQSLRLVYSTNLVDSTDQVWWAEYDVRRNFKTRGVKQSDNTYRGDFQHDIRFGGGQDSNALPTKVKAKLTVGRVDYIGNPAFSSKELAAQFKVSPGSKFDFVKSRKGIERLQKFYYKRDYLAARIQMDREDKDNQVNLHLRIESGKKVRIEYAGAEVSKSVRKKVQNTWQEGVSDRQRSQDAEEMLRAHFAKRGFLQAEVAGKVSEVPPDELKVVFEVKPGFRCEKVETVFIGATHENTDAIASRVRQIKLKGDTYVRPSKVMDDVTAFYRQKGYLQTKVDFPRLELDEARKFGKIIFSISEGPQVRVSKIGFEGNEALSSATLKGKLPLKEGAVLEPELLKKSKAAVAELYGRNGYRKPAIQQSVKLDEKQGQAEVSFTISEGIKSVIQSLKVEGENRVSEKYIREQLRIAEGEPLNVPETNQSIRNLYYTGAFSQVDISSEPQKGTATENKETEKVDVVVKVQEVTPYKFLYGAYYDTGRGPGVLAQLENKNSLGNARIVGLRGRYDRDLQEARLYFSQPLYRRHPFPTTATLYYRNEKDYYEGLSAERYGLTIQQERTIKKHFVLSYGYRLENVRSWYPDQHAPDPPQAIVAPFTVSVTRNTRDDFLDPTRGSFTSVAMEYSPGLFSSSYGYVRNFTQYFKYFPLFKPGYAPFQEDAKRPRTIYATGVRLGLMKGFRDNFVIPTERFYAGGGTSVRGFGQDELGPHDAYGDPLGGNAMIVLNNELRFPFVSILDGVGFVDIGNVFPEVSDFRFSELRKTAGFGIRLRTPSLMLRFDYGIKLDRKPGESFGAFFFSIGQAY